MELGKQAGRVVWMWMMVWCRWVQVVWVDEVSVRVKGEGQGGVWDENRNGSSMAGWQTRETERPS